MAAQYELLKELLNSGTKLDFGQEMFFKFYQAFILNDRWVQYIQGVGTTLLVTAIALALGGVHVNVTGLEKVPRKGRFLLVSNHRFAFDPIVFYAVMPWAELAFLSKKENFSIFIVAQVMREVLCLPVDRNNDRESLKSILKAIQFIKDDKASIAVFPEGGTNKTGAPLLPYRSGVFKIAQKANVPIVVCSLVNSRAILHNMFRKHTEVWLDVLDVVPAEELDGKTAIEVGERVHAVMEAGIVARETEQGLRA